MLNLMIFLNLKKANLIFWLKFISIAHNSWNIFLRILIQLNRMIQMKTWSNSRENYIAKILLDHVKFFKLKNLKNKIYKIEVY